jgi:hypothetical protein
VTDPLAVVVAAFDQPFRKLVAELAPLYPDALFSVRSDPIGSAGPYQGHKFYVQCCWPERRLEVDDHIILSINFCHLLTTPRINADVLWGGSGRQEAEFASEWSSNDDWPEATPAVMEQLKAQMPELIEVFRIAVARGTPVD